MDLEKLKARNFIEEIIIEDIKKNKNNGKVITRFPPEPNGYLHIGHSKSIYLNFGLAKKFNGKCHLRFDDTNPLKEDIKFVNAIKEDIKWLGFDWGENEFYASDYFDKMYEYSIELIKKGLAYVDDLSAEEIREQRGTLTEPGKESPYRNRSIEENLDLFKRMKNGEFAEGEKTLRAKIDMSHPNINMRDPVMYRILKAEHHRTGKKWCIYPTYDWAHGLEDAIENITHSICTLEFEDHRPLYDWFLDNISVPCHPRQIEFARLNLSYTVLSKRKLIELIEKKIVNDWDDPRMPTIRGLRRRGFTPEAIRNFCERIGVAKNESLVDMALLEHCLREDLNKRAFRLMGVLNPLKVVIINYDENKEEELEAINNPEDKSFGTRKIKFCRELYIERDDFMENPPKKFYRLFVGNEVRLRYAYIIKCEKVIKDHNGNIIELHCSYDPDTRGGNAPDNRKIKGTIPWVRARHYKNATVNLYDRLFTVENPNKYKDEYLNYINPNSLKVLKNCKVEEYIKNFKPYDFFQFERKGYFCIDPASNEQNLIINRSVPLRDTWAKISKKIN